MEPAWADFDLRDKQPRAWHQTVGFEGQNDSAMGPRLDTGGGLTLTESHY